MPQLAAQAAEVGLAELPGQQDVIAVAAADQETRKAGHMVAAAAAGAETFVAVASALFALSGPEQLVAFHQHAQETCNGTLHPNP